MRTNKPICVGDPVMINVQRLKNYHITDKMMEYDARECRVSKVYKTKDFGGKPSPKFYYQFEGVNATTGIPYNWLRDDFIRLNRSLIDEGEIDA